MFSASFPLNLTLCWTFNIFERRAGGGYKKVETNMLTGGVVTTVALDDIIKGRFLFEQS